MPWLLVLLDLRPLELWMPRLVLDLRPLGPWMPRLVLCLALLDLRPLEPWVPWMVGRLALHLAMELLVPVAVTASHLLVA